jgi:hypothetical protein
VYDNLEGREIQKWFSYDLAALWLHDNIGEKWNDPGANWPPEPKLPRWRRLMFWR